jgi:hypothetical protein
MSEIDQLGEILEFPHNITLQGGSRIGRSLFLCIGLKRFTYPSRLSDLEWFFQIERSIISRAFNYFVESMYEKLAHLVRRNAVLLSRENLESYSNAIKWKTGVNLNCVGFIDGTVRPISRPTLFQKAVYNGHKRVHSLKFQCISLPNGIIIQLDGPWSGKTHDARILRESNFNQISDLLESNNRYIIYGDPAYGIQKYIISPFKGTNLTEEQKYFNSRMSGSRVGIWNSKVYYITIQRNEFNRRTKIFQQSNVW